MRLVPKNDLEIYNTNKQIDTKIYLYQRFTSKID